MQSLKARAQSVVIIFLMSVSPTVSADSLSSLIEHTLNSEEFPRLSDEDWASTRALYERSGYQAFWTEKDKANAGAEKALRLLKQSSHHGLSPELYGAEEIANLAEALPSLIRSRSEPEERAEFDIRLTQALLAYARDLKHGRLTPKSLNEKNGAFHPGDIDRAELVESILAGIEEDRLAETFDAMAPSAEEYRRLQALLKRYEKLAENDKWPKLDLAEDTLLKPGDRNPQVKVLRQRLLESGDGEAEKDGADDELYDKSLEKAVKRFQHRNEIKEDGVVGPSTQGALNESIEERVDRIKLNLDRWRWLPADPGSRYLIVNVPEYRLFLHEENKQPLTMRVVLGEEMSPTPLFSDELEYLVLAPYWKIPYGIATEEILPKVAADRDYLRKRRLEIVDADKVVDPQSIDWNSETIENFPYNLRQKPGSENSLGLIKFIFPNQFAVYMHDTPENHLFSESDRAFSHGCIRLERPFELARILLDTDKDLRGIAFHHAERRDAKPLKIELKEHVPVYITYLSVRVPEGDEPAKFLPDVYGFDESSAKLIE